jgi:hypothetical protein
MKVVADRPLRLIVAVAASVAFALVAALTGFWLGREGIGGSFLDSGHGDVDQIKARATELERKLADIRLSEVVDGDASESLRQTIKSLRDELSASQEEVLFYRQLMAPSEAQRGLRIEKFELTPGGPGQIKYRLLLTQVVERHDWASGSVTLDITGTWDNEQVVLPLTDFSKVDSYPLAFRFRYLQEFSGILAIPAELTPQAVVITAATAGKAARRVQRTFSWTLEED